MVSSFGNIFEYYTYEIITHGNVMYHTCIMISSGIKYSHIILEIESGKLIYHNNERYYGTFPISCQS